jgi:hypothetical protein
MSEEERNEQCGRCDAPTPQDVGLNQAALDMDWDIAHYVFGISEEVLTVWPFPLPRFSTDKKWALIALDTVARGGTMPTGVDSVLCDVVWQAFKVRPTEDRLVLFLSALTPYAICKAVLTIARTHQYQESASARDDRLRHIRRVCLREVGSEIH